MGEQLGGLLNQGLGSVAPTAYEQSTGDRAKVVDDPQKLHARGPHDRFSRGRRTSLR